MALHRRTPTESSKPNTADSGILIFRKGLRLAKIITINVLLLAILTELVSIGFYFKRTGRLFYRTRASNAEEVAGLAIDEARLARTVIEQLHPYFGFTTKPGTPYKLSSSQGEHQANNYGFPSPYSYPFKKRDTQYVVGIFGGSVAYHYAIYEEDRGVLAHALKQIPTLRDKEIVILPFAYSGYKQPQQLLILNYFMSLGQVFDMVINIDGFNEVALSALNTKAGVEIGMPSIQHISPLVNLAGGNESTEELASLLRIKQYKEQLKAELQALPQCTLASCYTLRLLYVRYLLAGYRKEVGKYDQYWVKKFDGVKQDTLMQINRDSAFTPDSPEAFARMVDIWAESSQLMEQALAAKHVPYYHIIQPNQYNPTRRVFSAEETRVAIQEDSRYVAGVRGGYPVLLAKAGELNKSGHKVINAVNIFDEVQGAVYTDNCCHYNELGSSVFASFVANSVTAATATSRF